MNKRVVITGMGAVTPIGMSLDTFWQNLVNGVSGIQLIRSFQTYGLPVHVAAEISDEELCKYEEQYGINPANMTRVMRFARLAAHIALEDANLLGHAELSQTGIAIGSSLFRSNIFPLLEQLILHQFKQPDLLAPDDSKSKDFMKQLVDQCDAYNVAIPVIKEYKLTGPVLVMNSACSSGAQAIGEAYRMIKEGKSQIMICGGVDSMINIEGLTFFGALGVLSPNPDPGKASRPFDRDRNGFVLGEGAGLVVLESYDSAVKRRSRIWAEVIGYENLTEAYHISTPDPSCRIQKATILNALQQSGRTSADVDFINAHGTSTDFNDRVETQAMKEVFGERAYQIPITANKSSFGHLISAAGAVEFIATTLSLNTGVIPPTINYENGDRECDLDYVPNLKRRHESQVGISNSFAFGGQDVCLVLKKFIHGA